jgi:Immunoglobulin I-set domain
VRAVYQYTVTTPPESLAETLIFEYTNDVFVTNEFIVSPFFLIQPQSQSLFVGTNASFVAQAIHCTGYQWQKNGTNLMDDGHFFGTTNATLTVSNITLDDAGIYTVVAQHPSQPLTSTNAVLNVFKPIELSLTQGAPPGFERLLAGNADGSPFEASRLTNVNFYSTSDVSLSFSNWVLVSNSFGLTNGNLQADLPVAVGSNQFWRAVEQP